MLAGCVPLDGWSDLILTAEDLAIILFVDQAVEIVANHGHLAGVAYQIPKLLELGVGRPDLGSLLDLLGSLVRVARNQMSLGFLDGHIGGQCVSGNGAIDLGRREILSTLLETTGEFLGFDVVTGLHGPIKFIEVTEVLLHLELFLQLKSGDGGEILA